MTTQTASRKPNTGKNQTNEKEITEEDRLLKEQLELLVERLQDVDSALHRPALEALRSTIRSSTSSMTSAPKPLKFLKEKVSILKELHNTWMNPSDKDFLSDILSVLCMSWGEEGKRETLNYRLTGSHDSPGSWGHEYARHLSMEIMEELRFREDQLQDNLDRNTNDDLKPLSIELISFFMEHNAEADACDLAYEIDILSQINQYVTKDNYQRITRYLSSVVKYELDKEELYQVIYDIYQKVQNIPRMLLTSLEMANTDLTIKTYSCSDSSIKKQLAFILASQRFPIKLLEETDQTLLSILSNTHMHQYYMKLADEFHIQEPKIPDDIYKSHLENIRYASLVPIDTAKQSLASCLVNGLINAGFGKDKQLLIEKPSIHTMKENALLSSIASIGLIKLWDLDSGLAAVDKYLTPNPSNITSNDQDYTKAGALLAIGLMSCQVENDADPALALLSEYVTSPHMITRICAIMGLSIAYCGSQHESVYDLLLPIIGDNIQDIPMEVLGFASLGLGMVFVGSCHGEISSTIIQLLMEKDEISLKSPFAKFIALGLALLYLGRTDDSVAILETLKIIEHPIGKQASTLMNICSFAGTGDVIHILECLRLCNDHPSDDNTKDQDMMHQAFAVIGIGLIAMGEDIGTEMSVRMLSHLAHYGEPAVRRAVPLALALLYASHPHVPILDTLSKCSHDHDQEVALNSILALGLVGAGTNNARLDQMLRQLASYYHRENDILYGVRIAQGLVHMGKGLMTISPLFYDRSIVNRISLCGILPLLVCLTSQIKDIFIGRYPYILYYLAIASRPRSLIALDENLDFLNVTVRVGQAVDVVGQAGVPKTITGFQTHSTPVLLSYSERAELATERYIPLCSILEGLVILKSNDERMTDDDNDN